MNLPLRETARHCAAQPAAALSPAALRRDLLHNNDCQTGFTVLSAPVPARDQTAFKVCNNGRQLLIAVALWDALPAHITTPGTARAMNDELELYFGFDADACDWQCFRFLPDGTVQTTVFAPQTAAHSSAFRTVRLKRHRNELESWPSASYDGWRCRWIYAWFEIEELFGKRASLGFNLCRIHGNGEYSAWNFLNGCGGPDATGFGRLLRHPPAWKLDGITAEFAEGTLRLRGGITGSAPRGLRVEVHSPAGDTKKVSLKTRGQAWHSTVTLGPAAAGRYRLSFTDGTHEPLRWAVDIAGPPRDFLVSMTYDPPMSLMPNHYTPQRLHQEMAHLKTWGVRRIHWLDYSNFDALWRDPMYAKSYRGTVKHCGDFLTCAVTQAHANGLEFFAALKPFDLGFNSWFQTGKPRGALTDLEGLPLVAVPEIVQHQEWTLQTNPAWRRATQYPITRLRFYSQEPIPALKRSQIQLRTSRDNKTYEPYAGPLRFTQGTVRRRHQRWTPAGAIAESGAAQNWYIELSGLRLTEPFAVLQVSDAIINLAHPAFMLMEAEDASGQLAPLTVATRGGRNFNAEGYFFWKEWDGWNNYTEPILQHRTWNAGDLAFTFQEMPNMPPLLEPTYEGARDILLARIRKEIEAGVDGVSIRMLCHHNGVMSWLQYAFAPIVVELFESQCHRAPQTTPEDYERIRRLRGECLTQFLRDAKKLLAGHGKKLSVQFEPGMEVPPQYDTRMQFFFDYQTWLRENIVDEIELKTWTAHSAWIHEHLLPVAHRHGVPVHLISRCITGGLAHGEKEIPAVLLADAYRAGFDGFNYYETDNLIEMNPAGVAVPKGYADPALFAAHSALARL